MRFTLPMSSRIFKPYGLVLIVPTARREVILCAGTVKSPQVLELSGIGSSPVLESHGIPVTVTNEGVGENLRDHPMSVMPYELAYGITSHDSLRDPAVFEEARQEYKRDRTGPMGSGDGCYDAFTVLRDVLSDDDKPAHASLASLVTEIDAMDVPAGVKKQYSILTKFLLSSSKPSGQYILINGQLRQINTDGDIVSWKSDGPGNHVFITAGLPHPFSRGSINIATADPTVDPAIDPCHLSHLADRFLLTNLVRYIQKIASTERFPSQLKPNGIQLIPNALNMTDDEALNYISKTCVSEFHPIGTCAMLPKEDSEVVDPRLKVYGVANLRVVDASIFPIPCTKQYLLDSVCGCREGGGYD
jgi:choline dehydrogenase-like flavoprotein